MYASKSGRYVRRHAYDRTVLRVISDRILDALENAMLDGEIRRKDMEYWIEEIGRQCNIPDLIPLSAEDRDAKRWARVQWQKQLVDEIRARLSELKEVPASKTIWTKKTKPI